MVIRNRYILLLDLPLIAIAAFGAFTLRFDWLFLDYRQEFAAYLLAAVVIKPLAFFPFGMYARYWRYGSTQDLLAICLAVSASAVGMAVFVGLGRSSGLLPEFARPVIMIDWLLTLALAGGLRMSVRVIGDARQAALKPTASEARRVIVAGAGEAGTLVVRELRRNPQLGLHPVAFVDDAVEKWGKQILGLPVKGPMSALEAFARQFDATQVIIAMPTASGAAIRAAVDVCRQAGLETRVLPGVFELLDGHVSVNRLRKVEISDLLRRPQRVGKAEQAHYLGGKSVLVTGAGGSIGSELSRQVAFCNPGQVVLLGHGENSIFEVHGRLTRQYPGVPVFPVIADIRDEARLTAVFRQFRPEIVFHAAAHKHVPLMELNPEEAFTNNVRGTSNVIQAAEHWGVQRLVMISTDKAAAPSTIMGASKRMAESLVIGAGGRTNRPYVVVRFGNVLGSRGSVVPTLQAQIERGGPVTVTHPEMRRYFMTIPEAVQLVLQAGGMGTAGDLFVLNMGEQVRIMDLAHDLIRLSGVDPGSIQIDITGIRAGEKLEEELWEPGAVVEVTDNPDVFRIREHDLQTDLDIWPLLEDVLLAASSGDSERLKMSLALALPSFKPPTTTRVDGGTVFRQPDS